MGIIIYISDKYFESKKSIDKLSLKDSIIIGCSQIFALIPGFSRSGTTIASARCLKLKREDAAKFSFYLSAPIVAGACLLKVLDSETITLISNNLVTFITGIAISFISGMICIKFLLKYIKKYV